MNIKMLKAALAGLVLSVSGFANAGIIYTTVSGNGFGTIDTETGATTLIGNSGYSGTYGNAFDLDGSLFATITNNSLATVNMTTGVSTIIGAFGTGIYAIDFDTYGNLFGLGTNGDLYQINKTNAAKTLIGNTGFNGAMDIAFDSLNNLYATTSGRLYTVDVNTGGTLTNVGISSGSATMGLMFDENDVLWASTYSSSSNWYTVNTSTGLANLEYSNKLSFAHGGDIYVAASVPEPSTLTIFALGIMGLASRRFKKLS